MISGHTGGGVMLPDKKILGRRPPGPASVPRKETAGVEHDCVRCLGADRMAQLLCNAGDQCVERSHD